MVNRADIESTVESLKKELVGSAASLIAVQKLYGGKVREQTMKSYGRMVDAHMLIVGVLFNALFRMNGKFKPITSTSKQRSALFASFVIGMESFENAIAEGVTRRRCCGRRWKHWPSLKL